MRIRWSLKSCGYRLVCGGVLLGFLQFVIGFALPAWKRDKEHVIGLWQNCTLDLSVCHFYSTIQAEGWLDWVRAIEAMAVVGYCVCLFILGELNCSKKSADSVNCDRFILPAVCICTGILGGVGVTVYAVYEADGYSSFSSALYFSCVGSSFVLISGILFLCHKPQINEEDFDRDSLELSSIYHTSLSSWGSQNRGTLRALETDVFY